MENLIISINVVLPLFICILLGYFLRRIRLVEEGTLKAMNKLCFKVFLPIYLFNSVYAADLAASFNGKLIGWSIGGLIVLFVLLMLVIPIIEKDNTKRGVMVQAIFRSNFALFGLPVATSLCGEEGIGPTSLLLGIGVPFFNIMAVISLETFRGKKPSIRKMVRGVLTNPLIIACVLGILCNLLKVELPYAVAKSATDLGRVATPLSLVVLGGEFVFGKVKGHIKQLSIVILSKLVLSPLIMVMVGISLGFRKELLVPMLIMFGAPTAVSSFTMAQQMDGDADLAGEIVVFTSGLSIFTMFLWIFILKQLGFL